MKGNVHEQFVGYKVSEKKKKVPKFTKRAL
jgi:hypothetical protein